MFRETLEERLGRGIRKDTCLAVFFMDLDRFKIINDTFGHQMGDRLLQQTAERIRSCVRSTDCISRLKIRFSKKFIARQGGDEFTMMLPDLIDPEDAGRVAGRINETLSKPFHISGQELFVSVSIGISIFRGTGLGCLP